MPLPYDHFEIEKTVRAALLTLFSTRLGSICNVKDHRVYCDNETHLFAYLGFIHPVSGKQEPRCLLIDFAGVEDTDRGCADNPVYYLKYNLLLRVTHSNARSQDGSTSTDDFSQLFNLIRDTPLAFRQIGVSPEIYFENLAYGEAIFGLDNETLIAGHIVDFTARVEITPPESSGDFL